MITAIGEKSSNPFSELREIRGLSTLVSEFVFSSLDEGEASFHLLQMTFVLLDDAILLIFTLVPMFAWSNEC